MINSCQIKALDENELAYLFYCLDAEWKAVNMPYEMTLNTMKAFRNNTIQAILNKYSSNLTDENKPIIMSILNKLEANY
jgi:hypothetical protein